MFKKFILKLTLFFLPIAIIFGPFVYLTFHTGEWMNGQIAAQKLSATCNEVLFGQAFQNAGAFKMEMTKQLSPKILALGTSRVMQFRKDFFRDGDKTNFYNAGGAVADLLQFKEFLSRIEKNSRLQTLIIGLDQYFFNQAWANANTQNYDFGNRDFTLTEVFRNALKSSMKELAVGNLKAKNIFTLERYNDIGLNAIVKNDGFRCDGSYHYSEDSRGPAHGPDAGFKDTFSRIENGTLRFEYGETPSESAFAALKELLTTAQNRGFHVVLFSPPLCSSCYKKDATIRLKICLHVDTYKKNRGNSSRI